VLGVEIILRPVLVGGIKLPVAGRDRNIPWQHGAAGGFQWQQFGGDDKDSSSHDNSLHAPHGVSCEDFMVAQPRPNSRQFHLYLMDVNSRRRYGDICRNGMTRPCATYRHFGADCVTLALLIPLTRHQIYATLCKRETPMLPMTFEQQLHDDIHMLRGHSASPVEIHITRWGEPADIWVSWDVDLIVPPETMDADAVQLYTDLGVLLNHDPYRVLEEGIAPDRIGYMVSSEAAVY